MRKKKENPSLDRLPFKIWVNLILYLEEKDIASLRQTNRAIVSFNKKFGIIPKEIWCVILSYLKTNCLLSIRCVSRAFNRLIMNPSEYAEIINLSESSRLIKNWMLYGKYYDIVNSSVFKKAFPNFREIFIEMTDEQRKSADEFLGKFSNVKSSIHFCNIYNNIGNDSLSRLSMMLSIILIFGIGLGLIFGVPALFPKRTSPVVKICIMIVGIFFLAACCYLFFCKPKICFKALQGDYKKLIEGNNIFREYTEREHVIVDIISDTSSDDENGEELRLLQINRYG